MVYMVIRKYVVKSTVIFLLLLLIPMFVQTTQAQLFVEEITYPDIETTWPYVPLIYDNQYHNETALWEEVLNFELTAPEIIDVETIGTSYLGKKIKVVKITNELKTYQKAKTLVVSHHHGREQISVEVALRFIQRLVNMYHHSHTISNYIDTQEIYVIPTLNPDALDIVVNDGDNMLRKNARPYDDDLDGAFDEDPVDDVNLDGVISWYTTYEKNGTDWIYLSTEYEGIDNDLDGSVNEDLVGHIDLNRNYPTFFREGSGWNPDSLAGNYPGDTAFSEPEVQVFRDFALQHRFAMAYSLHSGTNASYFPRYSHNFYNPSLAWDMYSDFQSILPDYSFHTNDNFYPPEADPWVFGGLWDNWMLFERESLLPMTWELYGNSSALDEPIIFENSTHVITEWKGINNFYVPEEPYINDLWNDVQPAFDYLLENTPYLDISATLSSVDDQPGDKVNLYFNCINYSPRMSSVKEINVYNDLGGILHAGPSADPDYATLVHAQFNLPLTFVDTMPITIGNDYVGYYEFTLTSDGIPVVPEIGFSIIGIVIVSSGLSIYFIGKKKLQIN